MRTIITAALLGLAPAAALAADFSGSWVRDAARSKAPPYPNYWLTRSQPAAGGGNANAFVLEVRQAPAAVVVTDPIHPQRNYALDGKRHTAPTDTRMGQMTTTATMAGETFTVSTSQPYGGMPGNVTMTTRETWSLSPDGRVLTVATVRETPAAKQSYTEVYNRR